MLVPSECDTGGLSRCQVVDDCDYRVVAGEASGRDLSSVLACGTGEDQRCASSEGL